MVQPILSFKKILIFTKLSPKDKTVQSILSFKKYLSKRQYDSTHIVFLENFDQKTKKV